MRFGCICGTAACLCRLSHWKHCVYTTDAFTFLFVCLSDNTFVDCRCRFFFVFVYIYDCNNNEILKRSSYSIFQNVYAPHA